MPAPVLAVGPLRAVTVELLHPGTVGGGDAVVAPVALGKRQPGGGHRGDYHSDEPDLQTLLHVSVLLSKNLSWNQHAIRSCEVC